MSINDMVCGEFPNFCYRAFDKKYYAEAFVSQGSFRMNCLGYCRNMEDELRRDPTEGYGHTIEPDTVNVAYVSSDPQYKTTWVKEKGYKEHKMVRGSRIFCLCTCLPHVDRAHMAKDFGKYIVKINEPKKLAEDINDYFKTKGQKFIIEGCNVVYNKSQKLTKKLTNNERADFVYKQKPEIFITNCEFRIVALEIGIFCEEECKYVDGQAEPACQFLEINLNKRLGYLSLEEQEN